MMFFSTSLWASDGYTGVMSGEKQIKYVQSKWFDIIYPQECEQTARILFENADSLYEEISMEYGVEPCLRMPVVITPAMESFNAYWTDYPYNHIVVYDTAMVDDLAVFKETIFSTFKHELTHAVTYNLRSGFVKTMDKVFGESFSLSFWITSRGMGEGAAVAMESKTGEGRINDEFAMHQVKQAKIQNKFPAYLDVQTIIDVYPQGICYYFNAAFTQWLQQKYGMEKYAALWYRCLNMLSLTLDGAFKKVYEKDQNALWKEFIADYYVPQIPSDAVEAGLASYALPANQNETGRLFTNLSASQKGFVYLDENSDTVYFVDWKSWNNQTFAKPKKLFALNNIQSVKSSSDGRYLAVAYFSLQGANTKRKIKIFDVENSCFVEVAETGIQEPCIFQKDGEYYLACQSFKSQFYSVSLYKMQVLEKGRGNTKLKGTQLLWQKNLSYEQVPYSFSEAGNGDFAFILKNKLDYSVAVFDVEGNCKKEIAAPKDASAIRYLNYSLFNNQPVLTFTWTQKNSLPRYGQLNPATAEYLLDTRDISGGVYYPVVNPENQKQIVYVAKLFMQNKLYWTDSIQNNQLKKEKARTVNAVATQVKESSPLFNQEQLLDSKDYFGSFKYYTKGLLLPYSNLESISYTEVENQSLLLGLQYTTSNPWDSNSIILEAGYGLTSHSGAIGLTYTNGTDSELFKYSVSGMAEFDASGFKQTHGVFLAQSVIPFARVSNLLFQLQAYDYYGHSEFSNEILKRDFFVNIDQFAVGYSNVHKRGPGRYQKGGITLYSILSYEYAARKYGPQENRKSSDFFDLGLMGTIYIPNLLPFDCKKDFVYNLPVKISFRLFNETDSTAVSEFAGLKIGVDKVSDLIGFDAASFEAEAVLFDYEIQKGIPVINFLYAGDIRVSVIYGGGFNYDEATRMNDWHFMDAAQYLQKIQNHEILYKDFCALNLSVGITTIFGNPSAMVWSFKFIPDFNEKKVKFGFDFSGRY